VYGLEVVLQIQCEISSLKLTIDLLLETSEEEARFLELIHLDETHRDVVPSLESSRKVTWYCCTIKTLTNWEQVSSNPYGWVPTLLNEY